MTVKGSEIQTLTFSLILDNTSLMPVGGKTTRRAVRRLHQGMSDSEDQDDHAPEGVRPKRWQSLHVVCKYHNHHKPVYSLQRHLDVWHVACGMWHVACGSIGKNALHCKRLVWSLEMAARLPASKGTYWRMQHKVEPGNHLPPRASIPKAINIHSGFCT